MCGRKWEKDSEGGGDEGGRLESGSDFEMHSYSGIIKENKMCSQDNRLTSRSE